MHVTRYEENEREREREKRHLHVVVVVLRGCTSGESMSGITEGWFFRRLSAL